MMRFNLAKLEQLNRETHWNVSLIESLPSTNTHLQKQAAQSSIHRHALTTYEQTAGRGRHQKTWHANPGETLMISLGWTFPLPLQRITQGISLVIGLSILESILELCPSPKLPLRLKWPNDLLLDEKKLGGILIEIAKNPEHDTTRSTTLIIGIGLNWVSPPQSDVPQGIGLDKILPVSEQSTRHALLKALIIRINHNLECFKEHGFQPFRQDWMKHHIWSEYTPISWMEASDRHQGILHHLDEQGVVWVIPSGQHAPVALGEQAYTLRHRKDAE